MPRTQIETLVFTTRATLAARMIDAATRALARRRARAHLARLDAHLLRDIGLEPSEAQAEAGKPFWQP